MKFLSSPTFLKINMKIKINKNKAILILSYFILFFFTIGAVPNTYIGNHICKYIQLLLLLIVGVVCIDRISKGINRNHFYLLIVTFLLLIVTPLYSADYVKTIQSLSFFYCIFLGHILYYNIEKIVPLLYLLLFLNFLALLIEILFQIELVNRSDSYESSTIALLYKMGLFSSPKGGAFFIITVGLIGFLRKNVYILLLALISSLLTGVRVSAIGLILPLLYLSSEIFCKLNRARFLLMMLIAIGVSYYFLSIFFEENSQMLLRLYSSVDFQDASNIERFSYWKQHWNIYYNSDIMNKIFGNYNYAFKIVGNGAESLFLDLLNNYGFLSLLIFLFPILYCLKYNFNFKYFIFIGTIILLTASGRYCMSYSDAIVYWMIMFTFINNRKYFYIEYEQEASCKCPQITYCKNS